MTKWTLTAVSIACLVAASLPVAMQKPVTVYVEKPAPRMWTECGTNARIERDRICRARQRSEKVRM